MPHATTITLSPGEPGASPIGKVDVPVELGPVHLEEEIGRGSMGVVYRGHHRLLQCPVAVKFLLAARTTGNDPIFASFLAEARVAAAIRHPNLLRVLHADIINGLPYLVMDLIDGVSLRDLIRRTGALPTEVALHILYVLADAVGALHEQGILHRDIKPGNTLLNRKGEVFVTDYGLSLAWTPGDAAPSPHRRGGTPVYMAPEMFDGEVSPRSDVYALGITAFELLTGEAPFRAENVSLLFALHEVAPLPTERLEQRGVSPAVIEMLERTMHKNALYRFKTAHHFRDALLSAVSDEGVFERGRLLLASMATGEERVPAPDHPGAGGVAKDDSTGIEEKSSYFDTLTARAREHAAERDSFVTPPKTQPQSAFPSAPAIVTWVHDRRGWWDRNRAVCGYRLAVLCLSFVAAHLFFYYFFGLIRPPTWAIMVVVVVPMLAVERIVTWKYARHVAKVPPRPRSEWITRALQGSFDGFPGKCIARTMLGQGGAGETAIIECRPCLPAVPGIGYPFEPVPWDSSDESFKELHDALRDIPHPNAHSDNGTALPRFRRWLPFSVGRNLALRDQSMWTVLFIGVSLVVFFLPDIWTALSDALWGRQWSRLWNPSVLYLFGYLGWLLWVPARRGLALRRQCLLVPAGLLVRRASFWQRSLSWRNHLFKRQSSVLVLRQMGRGPWRVSIVDPHDELHVSATLEEVELLLRAWLSPLPPPSEYMIDGEWLVFTKDAATSAASGDGTGDAAPRNRQSHGGSQAQIPELPCNVSSPAGNRVVRVNIPCAGCQYSLLGLSEGGKCPECGLPLAASFDPQRLILSDKGWVHKLAKGVKLIHVSICLPLALLGFAIMTALATMVTSSKLPTNAQWIVSPIVRFGTLITAGCAVYGIALIYAQRPKPISSTKRRWLWLEKLFLFAPAVIVILPIAMMIAMMAATLEWWEGIVKWFGITRLVIRSEWFGISGIFGSWVSGFLLCRRLAHIAVFIPDSKTHRHLRFCGWSSLGLIPYVGISIALEAWLPLDNQVDNWSLGITSFVVVAIGLWSWSLISTMRRKLRSAWLDHVEPAELFGTPLHVP